MYDRVRPHPPGRSNQMLWLCSRATHLRGFLTLIFWQEPNACPNPGPTHKCKREFRPDHAACAESAFVVAFAVVLCRDPMCLAYLSGFFALFPFFHSTDLIANQF
jgi:hypothetical protein